jgi:hypothetical protein
MTEQVSQVDRRSLRGRELQDAAKRGDRPVSDSALFRGAELTIRHLEHENASLRASLRDALELNDTAA